MIETWRWYGPHDAVSLSDARQAGATGIVTALHDVPVGEVWTRDAVAERRAMIEAAGLRWKVVESLPVPETVRAGSGDRDAHIEAWITSLHALAAEDVRVVCYNFMPAFDWTRTDLAHRRPSGATALRFDYIDYVAFDRHVLARSGADYPDVVAEAADKRAAGWSNAERERICATILAGLPGATSGWTLDEFRARLAPFAGATAEDLHGNLRHFLQAVVPEAEALGMRLCCHPDDPPWPLFGLPRILSTEADYQRLVDMVPSPANGITLCTGSLGARPDNDLPGMVERLGDKVHFLHLRNVRREDGTVPGSFFEDDHLAGSTDMVAVLKAVHAEEARRRAEGRADADIPMRPDHGQVLLSDADHPHAPGYPAIGRLKGLAELRGVWTALQHG
ncbi:mannonate dehydratase [Pseudaestuariivita atlantica]|uniref:Mannonate dehydratase n=1 Tax=Pseudaestuariivita atlantica TaxID=1317121 RepID=A0A0L1JNP1_9RHOB|nr:mannonate dehydratase [Pseudaestuariivita atlantica]KNG93376.1 mannonate dehydratase [Pseudaestuariivita atlantica]